MSEKIANDAAQRAQEIHKAITQEAGPSVVTPKAPENPTGEGPQPDALLSSDDPTLLRAEVAQWKQRYQVLKGKYDAEVPRLNAELKSLQGRLAELENQHVATAKTSLDDALQTVRDELGDKVADSLARLIPAPGAPSASPTPAAQPTAPTPEGEGNDDEATVQLDHVRAMVDAAVNRPGTFDQVNYDPAFIAYLAQTPHPQTQRPLQEYMQQKFAEGDLPEVARVFLSFVNLRARQAKDEADKKRQGVATPDVPAAGGNRGTEEKPTYTRAEYEATMKSLNHDPKYRTAEGIALAKTVRTELLEALRDGRVVG